MPREFALFRSPNPSKPQIPFQLPLVSFSFPREDQEGRFCEGEHARKDVKRGGSLGCVRMVLLCNLKILLR